MAVSFSRQQAKLLKDGFLDNIGQSKSDEVFELDNVAAVLYEFAADFETEAIQILHQKNAVASGNLEKSFNVNVRFANNVYTLTIKLADYFDFVNKGVKGLEGGPNSPYSFKSKYPSKKMALAILLWLRRNRNRVVNIKKATSKLERKGRALARKVNKSDDLKGMAYAMSAGIKKHGLKKTGFFDIPYQHQVPLLKDKLAKALKEDFRLEVKKINQAINVNNGKK